MRSKRGADGVWLGKHGDDHARSAQQIYKVFSDHIFFPVWDIPPVCRRVLRQMQGVQGYAIWHHSGRWDRVVEIPCYDIIAADHSHPTFLTRSEGEAHNEAGANTVALPAPKGGSNGEHKAALNLGGVFST